MSMTIRNQALYHDRTVQDWHRETFPSDYWAIDLDLVGVYKHCKQSLYAIESTTNPNKPLSILSALAAKLGIPGLMILHSNGAIVYAQVVGESRKLTRDQLEAGINRLRENHYANCQRRRA
jgi:hypothetical protein